MLTSDYRRQYPNIPRRLDTEDATPNFGFTNRDNKILKDWNNPLRTTNIYSVIVPDEDEEEPINKIDYCCANCTSLLTHYKKLNTQYYCRLCSKFYDITKDHLLTRSDLQEDGVIYVTNELRGYEKMTDYIEEGSKIQPTITSINPDRD